MKRTSYNVFRQIVRSAADKAVVPLRVMFELTYDCNFRCKHCYIPGSFRAKYRIAQLDTRQVFGILDMLKNAGCLFLGLTGGEPFIRKDIFEIIEYAISLGFRLTVNTNGSFLNSRAVRRLARAGPIKIDITLPGMSRPVFESITGDAGSHRKVFKAIDLLRRNRIPLGLKSCLLRQNENEIKAIRKFARCLRVPYRLDTLLSRRLDGSAEPYKLRGGIAGAGMNKPGSIRNRPGSARDRKVQRKQSLFFCGAGRVQAAVTPAGELKLCLMIPEPKYDMLESGFDRAWKKARDLAKMSKPDNKYSCRACQHRQYCVSCPARGWLYAKNFSICDPFIRSWLEQGGEKHAAIC